MARVLEQARRAALQLAGRPEIGVFTTTPTEIDPATGRVEAPTDGITHLLVAGEDPTLRLRGEVVGEADDGAVLLAPESPWQADWQVDGVGKPVQRLLVYPESPGQPVSGTADLVIRLPDEVKRGVHLSVRGEGPAFERDLEPNSEVAVPVRFASDGSGPASIVIEAQSDGVKADAKPAVIVREATIKRG